MDGRNDNDGRPRTVTTRRHRYNEVSTVFTGSPSSSPEITFRMPRRSSFTVIDEQISLSDRFCRCRRMDECQCGENDEARDWYWNENAMTSACQLTKNGTELTFHPRFSVGTACVRADRPLRHGYQHYFEVKILTPCFGTDIMIGIGTEKTNMAKYERRFGSLLGSCVETWGMSYKGNIYHNDKWSDYHDNGFGQGSIVGVHVDLWRGRLSYYINRKLIGVAFINLCNPMAQYYPMICSTAAKSSFRLIAARSYKTNLQYFCCEAIRQAVPYGERFLPETGLPPPMKNYLENNMNWLMVGTSKGRKRKWDDETAEQDDGPSTSSTSTSPLTGAGRLAKFAHRMAMIPLLTLQLGEETRWDGAAALSSSDSSSDEDEGPVRGRFGNEDESSNSEQYGGPTAKRYRS